jgi:hypothetical protein
VGEGESGLQSIDDTQQAVPGFLKLAALQKLYTWSRE